MGVTMRSTALHTEAELVERFTTLRRADEPGQNWIRCALSLSPGAAISVYEDRYDIIPNAWSHLPGAGVYWVGRE